MKEATPETMMEATPDAMMAETPDAMIPHDAMTDTMMSETTGCDDVASPDAMTDTMMPKPRMRWPRMP